MGLCASVPCAKGDPNANADVVPVENGADGPVVTKEWYAPSSTPLRARELFGRHVLFAPARALRCVASCSLPS